MKKKRIFLSTKRFLHKVQSNKQSSYSKVVMKSQRSQLTSLVFLRFILPILLIIVKVPIIYPTFVTKFKFLPIFKYAYRTYLLIITGICFILNIFWKSAKCKNGFLKSDFQMEINLSSYSNILLFILFFSN